MSRFAFDLNEIGKAITAPLVVVMPIYNEEANIERVIAAWSECLQTLGTPFQILALDDGSRDGTLASLHRLEAAHPDRLCVLHKPNSGHGMSCRMGYEIAIRSQAEWILQIDSDGQCDPVHFPEFWQLREGHDCVFGVRKKRDDGFARVLTSAICRLGSSVICGQDLRDPNVPYRLIHRQALATALRHIPPAFNIHNVALTYVLKRLPGLRWAYVPIHFRDRQGGTNSINVLRVTTWGAEMLLELLHIRAKTGHLRSSVRPVQEWARNARIEYFLPAIQPGDRVLEIGSGDGWFRQAVVDRIKVNYLTMDTECSADIRGDILDWKQLGLTAESYDVIVAFEVVEHVDCFAQCLELLKPGGLLLLTTPMPHMDWLLKIVEALRLTQKRTSPHSNLVYLKDIPRFTVEKERTPYGIGQWAVLRKPAEVLATQPG